MSLSLLEADKKQKTEKLALYVLGALACFYAVFGTLLYHIFNSNIVISKTVLPQLWDVIIYLTSYLFYWVAFAFFVHLASNYSLRECKRFLIICAACLLARYLLSFLIGWIMLRERPIWEDLWQFLIEMLFDTVQFGCAIFFVYRFLLQKTKKSFDPQSRLFSFSDPFHLSAFLLAAIPSAIKLLTRIRYDLFYGVPQNLGDLLGMIFWYALDISIVLIGYLLICWLMSELVIQDRKVELLQKENKNT